MTPVTGPSGVLADRTAAEAALGLACLTCETPLLPGVGAALACPRCGAAYAERDGILDLSGPGEGPPGYDRHYFGTLPLVEDRHFWFRHRREVIRDALRRHVPDLARRPLFDVGCGAGGLLAYLEREGVPLLGACDAYFEGLHRARPRVTIPLVLVRESGPPPLAPGQKMISLFDVLEHLDDDEEILRFFWSVLEPGGILALTVPAHPFLFDEMDELAHHRRRYRKRELRRKLQAAGFEVRSLEFFMSFLVPLLLLVRFLGRLLLPRGHAPGTRRDAELRVVPVLNPILGLLLRMESMFARRIPLPFGTSLVAIAERPR